MTEVRASALAVCILFSDVAGFDESAQFFREELEDILTIDVGHFKEVKDTLRNISNMWNTEIKENEIPSRKNVLIAARWVVNNANTAEKVVAASNFANQILASSLYDKLINKAKEFNIVIQLNPVNNDLNTIVLEDLIIGLSNL